MKVTKTIFCHPGVYVSWNPSKSHRTLRVCAPVAADTLLLVEHCLSGSKDAVSLGIAADRVLFDTLAPRGAVNRTKHEGLIKAKMNVFASPIRQEWVVSRVISAASHSCKPNCIVSFILRDVKTVEGLIFPCDCMYLYAIQNLEAGEELTIAYATRSQIHSEAVAGFQCACDAPPETVYQAPTRDLEDALKTIYNYIDDEERSAQIIANIVAARELALEFGDNEPVVTNLTKDAADVE